ncbi:MAG: hypothetical protein CME65_11035 [Halobacteriovoraceae bacterium]|nr:hypothetical protein [Halobacteriovoraceae bacterium]|tara:strand:- start:11770 stop:12111 length:342 start_codon:yes stop_codon:yes gene_type:complete
MKLVLSKNNQEVASQVKLATSFKDRLLGLMFVEEMKGFDALIIEPCRSIHNFFVRFSIDAVFVDRNMKIVKILRDFKPWYLSGIYFRAHKVIEMKAGAAHALSVGDQLEVRDV